MGALLLPPSSTGVRPASERPRAEGLTLQPPRADRVYLFTRRNLADVWAATHTLTSETAEYGSVYEVEPEGELEQDPEPGFAEGVSWQCPRARILAVQPLGLHEVLAAYYDVRRSHPTGGAQ